MSENTKTTQENAVDQKENYEKDKSAYEVMDYYDSPAWYKRGFVWLWPMIVAWLFITINSAPEYRLVSSVSFGAAVVGFQVMAWLMQAFWPISKKK